MNTFFRFAWLAGIFAACVGPLLPMSHAAIPPSISYQGYITNAGGTPITNATQFMSFRIYNTNSGGSALYTENLNVNVANGLFNVRIGAGNPITLPFDVPYYLGVTVGTDAEMTPRQPLASSAYAFRAVEAESAQLANGISPGANINLAQPSTSTTGNILKGGLPFIHNAGVGNTFAGESAGNFTLTGPSNTGVGRNTLTSLSSGASNTAVGRLALFNTTAGANNVAVGNNALLSNSTGSNNVALGVGAGMNITTSSNNIAIGNSGEAGDSGMIRIGTSGTHNFAFIAGVHGVNVTNPSDVVIGASGILGTSTLQRGEASVGAGANGVNTFTVNFPTAFAVAPKVVVTPKLDLDVGDTFAVTIRSISTTQFRVNVYRVDIAGGSWSANVRLEWQAWN